MEPVFFAPKENGCSSQTRGSSAHKSSTPRAESKQQAMPMWRKQCTTLSFVENDKGKCSKWKWSRSMDPNHRDRLGAKFVDSVQKDKNKELPMPSKLPGVSSFSEKKN